MKTRAKIAKDECNCDPIFLFQLRRTLGVSEEYVGEVVYDCDAESYRYNGRKVTEDYLIKNEMLLTYWQTESVWMYREEAENEGLRKAYRYGKKQINWRVYCLCARGSLVQVLEKSDELVTA